MLVHNNLDAGPNITHRIKSFVRREGRMTRAQQRAFATLWKQFGVDLSFSSLDVEKLFGRYAPLTLEIGFGDGEALLALCEAHPEMDFLGVEVYRPGIGHLLLRAAERELRNLRIISADIVEIMDRYLSDRTLDRIHIFFPDPWPKSRHHKRRLIQPAFAALMVQKMKILGQLHIATDCESYAHSILETLATLPALENLASDHKFMPSTLHRPLTKFEQRARQSGHSVWEIRFKKMTN